jgi:hypothetical protein
MQVVDCAIDGLHLGVYLVGCVILVINYSGGYRWDISNRFRMVATV